MTVVAAAAPILDAISEGVVRLDASFTFTYANAAAAQLLGRPRERLLGKSAWLEFPELETTSFGSALRRATSERSEVLVVDHYAPLGRSFEVRVQPSDDGVLVVLRDRTQSQELQSRLAHVEDELQMVSDTVPAHIAYIDANETYQFVNRTAATWYGLPADAVLGLHVSAILGDAGFGAVQPQLARALRGETFTFREHIVYPTGARWVEATLVPRLVEGRAAGAVLMALDVTDRHREELERAALLDELQVSEATGDAACLRYNHSYTPVHEDGHFGSRRDLPRRGDPSETAQAVPQ